MVKSEFHFDHYSLTLVTSYTAALPVRGELQCQLWGKRQNLYNCLPDLDRIYCNAEEAGLVTSKQVTHLDQPNFPAFSLTKAGRRGQGIYTAAMQVSMTNKYESKDKNARDRNATEQENISSINRYLFVCISLCCQITNLIKGQVHQGLTRVLWIALKLWWCVNPGH